MARATNDLNAVRMMLGPGVMYWCETSLTFALSIAIMVRTDWRLTLLAILPAPVVSARRDFFRPHDSRPLREDPGACFPISVAACRRTWPACGWSAPTCRSAPELRRFEDLNQRLYRAEHQAGADAGRVPTAAGDSNRGDVPDGAVDRAATGAGRDRFRSAAS